MSCGFSRRTGIPITARSFLSKRHLSLSTHSIHPHPHSSLCFLPTTRPPSFLPHPPPSSSFLPPRPLPTLSTLRRRPLPPSALSIRCQFAPPSIPPLLPLVAFSSSAALTFCFRLPLRLPSYPVSPVFLVSSFRRWFLPFRADFLIASHES